MIEPTEHLADKDLEALWVRATTGLNTPQTSAVTTLDGPVLVVAGPGSGKTRVLTHRIAALVASGVAPEEILAVTFTNKAAEEMRDRVGELLGPVLDQDRLARMWVCTFHSACVRILRAHPEAIGRTKRFAIADSDDAKRILSRLLNEVGMADQARDLVHQISLAKNQLLSPSTLEGPRWHPQLAHWWRRYQDALAAQDLVDFDDLLLGALGALTRQPEVAAAYRARFRYILVDEFQDTNKVQYAILSHLGAHRNVCVVGDADQAVYGFRGATPTIMAAFEADWPGTEVVVLAENYRSTPAILAVAQAIIDQNTAHHRPRLTTLNPPGPPVTLRESATDLDEARWVAREITRSPVAPGEHAVIYRTNAQSRVLEQAMRDAGVPYRIVGGVSFFDSAEIRDAMAWLRLAQNPRDQAALRRAASAPKRGVGTTTLDALIQAAEAASQGALELVMVNSEAVPSRARKPLERFATAVTTVQAAMTQGPVAAIDAILALEGFVDAACTREGRDKPEARRENLEELAAAARAFMAGTSAAWPASILDELDGLEACEAFTTNAALLSAADESGGPAVQLMTAHAAKGREFDAVFVVGVEDGFFPHASSSSSEEVDEEVRLLFVAASRARHRLALSWARERLRYTKREEREISPLITPALPLLGLSADPGRSNRHGSMQNRPWLEVPRGALSRRDPLAPIRPQGPRVRAEDLAVGTKVIHDLYGPGQVVTVDRDVATVRFASGVRAMMLELAPMRIDDTA